MQLDCEELEDSILPPTRAHTHLPLPPSTAVVGTGGDAAVAAEGRVDEERKRLGEEKRRLAAEKRELELAQVSSRVKLSMKTF